MCVKFHISAQIWQGNALFSEKTRQLEKFLDERWS